MHYSTLMTVVTALAGAASAYPARGLGAPVKAKPIRIGARSDLAGLRTRNALASGARVLKPVKFQPEGVAKRQAIDFSNLDLATQAQLIYGSPESDGSLFLANMTLHASSGHPLLMMENFETLTSAIDCDGSDGKMSLTFKDQTAMDYAFAKWAWINKKEESAFIMIANHEGCGPADERVPYMITGVSTVGLTTSLNAIRETWSAVASDFEIDFGRASLPNAAAKRMVKRQFGFLDDIVDGAGEFFDDAGDVFDDVVDTVGDVAGDVGDAIGDVVDDVVDVGGDVVDAVGDVISDIGSGDIDGDVSIPLDTGNAGVDLELFSDPTGTITIKCVDCSLKGSIFLTGRVAVDNFIPSEVTFTAAPVDVVARAELGVTISAALDQFLVNPLSFSQNIVSIPLGGIVIPGIFSVGPKLDLEIGAELVASAEATFTFGVTASLPNSAQLSGNLLDLGASSATGFEGASAEFLPFTADSITASITASAFASPILSLGFEILNGAFGAEASLKFRTPALEADITAEFNNAGVCSNEAGASRTGVQINSKAVIDGSIFLGTDQTLGEIALFDQTLFSFEFPLADFCFPIDIPGLDAVEEAPAEEAPVEEAPVEEAPVEEAPVEEAPVEETPVEEAPVEEAPVEEAPVEEAPVEEAPVEESPVEEAPVEEAPVEEAPVEEAPVEDAHSAEAPPAPIAYDSWRRFRA